MFAFEVFSDHALGPPGSGPRLHHPAGSRPGRLLRRSGARLDVRATAQCDRAGVGGSVRRTGLGRPRLGSPRLSCPGFGSPRLSCPGSAAPSAGTGGTLLTEVASGVQFQTTSLEAPAGQPFGIEFDNQDPSIPHNIEILDASGAKLFEGDTVTGPAKTTYSVPALSAGTYKFVCKWHPNMVGQLTAK